MKVEFDSKIFDIESVKRAAYRLADRIAFDFSIEGDRITAALTAVNQSIPIESLSVEFRREVLDQDLRDRLSRETQQVRNMILASAFSKTSLIAK